MDKSREEIPQWTWYNGNFMFQFDEELKRNPSKSIKDFFLDFKKNQGIAIYDFYHTKNQGIVILLMYGLLIIPKEIWEREKTNFPFESKKYFKIITGNNELSTLDFLRLLRNALAHANFSINAKNSIVTFWNINSANQINFEVQVQYDKITIFMSEIGKYYINEVKNK